MFETVSLFCGCGGEMAGKRLAFEELGIPIETCKNIAVNHWDLAVLAAQMNYPEWEVRKEDLTLCDATQFGITHLDMLWASPSCTSHSTARGGVPCNDQQRSHADEVIDRWLAKAVVDLFLLENVPVFVLWGSLLTERKWCTRRRLPGGAFKNIKGKWVIAGRPDPEQEGIFFERFIERLKAIGYTVDHRVLCAADYGDPTQRRRLFLQAARDGKPITWPAPTHDQFGRNGLPAWKTTRNSVIDWSIHGKSIFERGDRPLKPNTLKRIRSGLKKFGLKPFLNYMTHTKSNMSARSLDRPLPTITTAKGGELMLVEPYLMQTDQTGSNGACVRGIDSPTPTLVTRNNIARLEPYLMEYHAGKDGHKRTKTLDDPLPTADCSNRFGLVEPYMVNLRGTGKSHMDSSAKSIDEPTAALTTGNNVSVVEPFLVALRGTKADSIDASATSLDRPSPALTAGSHLNLVEPCIIKAFVGGCTNPESSIDKPLPTVTANDHNWLLEPYLIEYYGTADASTMNEPLLTVTTKERHAMVAPEIKRWLGQPLPVVRCEEDIDKLDLTTPFLLPVENGYVMVDLLYRLLVPLELAKAMGFPDWYVFNAPGVKINKTAVIKMIGNACPVGTVKALIKNAVLARREVFGLAA